MAASLALQLYSLRREFGLDPIGTLRLVPSLGYDSIELAGTYNWSVDQWKNLLQETKLLAISAHVGMTALETDWSKTADFYRAIGCQDLVMPSIPNDLRHPAGFNYTAQRLNVLGRRGQSAGLTIGYHNHAFEFEKLEDGSRGIDILLGETDPALVGFEVDTYWVERGGVNARQFIEQHAGRIRWIHAKELRKRDSADVPAGTGDVDFRAIVPKARQSGWPVVVEYEGENAVDSVKQGATYLQTL